MVHNGIEYGDMQLCAEAYFLLKHLGGYDNQRIHESFTKYLMRQSTSHLPISQQLHP
jgi:6-phosphogluconate dehydrogenase